MTPEPDIHEGLAKVAETTVWALSQIATATSPAVSLQACDALSFTLHALGPAVARRSLAAVARDLEVEIESLNGGASTIN
jgi:hypothetical protein